MVTKIFPERFNTCTLFIWCLTPVLFFAPSFCSAETASINSSSVIIVGGDHNYPPYEFLDENQQPAGFNVDLTRAIAEVMGISVTFKMASWDTVRHGLDIGEIDILQGMVSSEGRSWDYDFSPPHTIVHESVFARSDTHPRSVAAITSLAQLAGKELIVQKGGIRHDQLIEQKLNAKLFLVDTHAAALRLLASGQHDYALVGNLPGLYLGKELGLSNIKPVGSPFAAQHYCYAVRKGNAELLAIFSEGLAILKNTGRYQQLYDKWLGPLETVAGFPWRKVAPVLIGISAGALLIFAIIMFWNRTLKNEVERRSKELQDHQQQLIQADKLASLGILVSGVAHEINNPNSLILMNMPIVAAAHEDSAGILEDYYQEHGDFSLAGIDYSRMRDELPLLHDEMFDAAKRIKRIVEDLKDFARPEPTTDFQPLNINDVVQTAVRLVENSLNKATRHFSQQYAPDLPLVSGQRQRIEQVIVNLLLNACQALPDTERGITLVTRYLAESSEVCIEVQDQGKGIDPEHLPHVTDPFFTTKRESGGTGLGLSVSATIVQQHGGSLTFTSESEGGTVAALTLPVFV